MDTGLVAVQIPADDVRVLPSPPRVPSAPNERISNSAPAKRERCIYREHPRINRHLGQVSSRLQFGAAGPAGLSTSAFNPCSVEGKLPLSGL